MANRIANASKAYHTLQFALCAGFGCPDQVVLVSRTENGEQRGTRSYGIKSGVKESKVNRGGNGSFYYFLYY